MQDEEITQLSKFEDNYWWNQGRRRILCDLLYKQINGRKNLKILDVGCGSGGTSTAFLQFGQVTGTDFSSLALKFAKNRGLTNVVKSSVTSIPFSSEKFDIITVLDVIEHVKEDNLVLNEIWRMLKPNGIVVVTVPAFQFLWSEHDVASMHVRRYNNSSIVKVINESKFKIIKISYFVTFLFPFIAMYRLLIKRKIKEKKAECDFIEFPKLINSFFEKIMRVENKLLKKINFPFGLSIVCLAQKA